MENGENLNNEKYEEFCKLEEQYENLREENK